MVNDNKISNKIRIIRAKQQLCTIKNSVEQVDIFQKQFNEDTQKHSLENCDNHKMQEKKFLKEQNLFLCKKHFDILRSQEVTSYSFLIFINEEFQKCRLEIGSSKVLVTLINDIHNEANNHDENFKVLCKELSEKICRSLYDELSEDIHESLCEEFSKELCKSI
ncbi:6596_t:CDS:2 [Funneliformis mosseae]|uniref:6596_t:CDS:1 n=1 Tax=Funneliformis mosseae TaxID=27381 RepID=A0A9N9N5Y1_FUNMO|nr:6596_t:CDS:2 [Funneliformis mosseae]